MEWNSFKRRKRHENHHMTIKLPFNDCLPCARHCAGTFVYVTPKIPKSPLLWLALDCVLIGDTTPGAQGPQFPPSNWGANGLILQSERYSERLSTLPKAIFWLKAASGFKSSSLLLQVSFPVLFREQLWFMSFLLVDLIQTFIFWYQVNSSLSHFLWL